MDIRVIRNTLKSYINNEKARYEAALKLDQALAYYEGMETKIKEMDTQEKQLAASILNKKGELEGLMMKLAIKTTDTEKKLSTIENDGAAKLEEAHVRYANATRKIESEFKTNIAKKEAKIEILDDRIKIKEDLLEKIDKVIDKHKKEFGSFINA